MHDPVFVPLAEAQSRGRAACSVCFPEYNPGQTRPSIAAPDDRATHHNPANAPGAKADPLEALAAALDTASRSVAAGLAAGVDRTQLTDLVAHALIDMRAQVWPDAGPPRRAREQ